jgi:hypothetical protein
VGASAARLGLHGRACLVTVADAAHPAPTLITGAALPARGAAALLTAFAQLAIQGRGTPAPPAPTGQLVGARAIPARPQSRVPGGADLITGLGLPPSRPVLLSYAAAVSTAFIARLRV